MDRLQYDLIKRPPDIGVADLPSTMTVSRRPRLFNCLQVISRKLSGEKIANTVTE